MPKGLETQGSQKWFDSMMLFVQARFGFESDLRIAPATLLLVDYR